MSDGYGQLSYKGRPVYAPDWRQPSTSTSILKASCSFATTAIIRLASTQPTYSQAPINMRDAASKGRMTGKKLTLDQVIEIRQLLAAREAHKSIAGSTAFQQRPIGQISRGETWKQTASPIEPESEDGSLDGTT